MEDSILLSEVASELFSLAFNESAAGIAVVLPDGRIAHANGEFCRQLGYTAAEMAELTIEKISRPDDVASEAAAYARVLGGESTSYRVAKRFVRRDGETTWVQLSVSLLRDSEGSPRCFLFVSHDDTPLRHTEAELTKANERYVALCESVSDLISIRDSGGKFVYVSSVCLRMLGYTPAELVGSSFYDLLHPDDREVIVEAQSRLSLEGSHSTASLRLKKKTGEYIWVEVYSQPATPAGGNDHEIISVTREAREPEDKSAPMLEVRKLADEHSRAALAPSLRDELTRLLNRRALDELLRARLASRRSSNYPFGLLMVDVDNFAGLNDRYGREACDAILTRVGQLLAKCCRNEDFVGRYDGDGYVIVLPRTDAGGTVRVGERIIGSVASATWPELSPSETVTVSVGGTCVKAPANLSADETVALLQVQLGQAKELGRNCLVMNARQTTELTDLTVSRGV